MSARLRVLVAGGGIGGVAAAIACARAGHEVEVYERAPRFGEVGAGITLWANGLIALERLGVELPAVERPLRRLRMSRAGGGEFATVDVTALEERHGAGIQAHARATVLAALHDALPDGALRLDSPVTGYRADDGGVELELAGGRRARGDVLIGADGIHSTIRRELLGDAEARPLGAVAWRCISNLPAENEALDEARQIWGRGGEFGWVPLMDGRIYWFAAERERPDDRDHPGGVLGALIERFGDWAPEIEPMVAASDPSRVLRTELLARSAPRSWSRGRVALLGDSAHAMAPNLGQGACQALEDAIVLQRVLTGVDDPVPALREYSRARVLRAKAVSVISEWTGSMIYIDNGLLWRLRDLAFGAAPELALRLQLDRVIRSRALRA